MNKRQFNNNELGLIRSAVADYIISLRKDSEISKDFLKCEKECAMEILVIFFEGELRKAG